MLIGEEALIRLGQSRVAVFGVGGVGGYAVEALARCGIGTLDLIDSDRIAESNINRQIIALTSTVGQYKVDAAAARVKDISPKTQVNVHRCFYLPENADSFDLSQYDCIIDAVDTVTAKLEIITRADAAGVPVISAMGAGNKLDPSGFRAADIYETKGCPLARVIRRELRKRNIKRLRVVYSEEEPIRPLFQPESEFPTRRDTPGSISFVPSAAGLVIASETVKALLEVSF